MQKQVTLKPQIDKFREAARELETDDREEAFDAILHKIGRVSPEQTPETKTRQKATPSSRTKSHDGD